MDSNSLAINALPPRHPSTIYIYNNLGPRMNLTLSSQTRMTTNADDKLTDALAFLQFALSCLQETMSASGAAFFVVPILSVANAVVRTIQAVRSNEDRAARLLERLSVFINHMSRFSGYPGLEDEDFIKELRNLECTLQKTYNEILKLQRHTRTRKFLQHESISGILDRCLDTIDDTWRAFDATALFRIQQRLIDEDKCLKTILRILEERNSDLSRTFEKLEAQESALSAISDGLLHRIDGARERLEHQVELFVRSQNQALEHISKTQERMLNMLQAERRKHADCRFLTMQPAFMATCMDHLEMNTNHHPCDTASRGSCMVSPLSTLSGSRHHMMMHIILVQFAFEWYGLATDTFFHDIDVDFDTSNLLFCT